MAQTISQQQINCKQYLEGILFDEADIDGYIARTFTPVRYLGNGSFSTVLECKEKFKDHSVAIKVINKQNVKRTSLDMLGRESSFLQQINHPNVVGFYEQRESPNKIYIILELVKGYLLTDLIEQHIRSGQPFNETDIVSIISQLILGLEYIHKRGIIHRDLKPENILVKFDQCGKMQLKIIDFGLSFQKTQNLIISQQGCGTLLYMAPEVVFRKQYNQKVDMWSLGIIQYVLYHPGQHPILKPSQGRKNYLVSISQYDSEKVQFSQGMSEYTTNAQHRTAQSFFKKTVAKLPEDRMSASQSIQHPWLSGIEKPTPITMSDMIKRVENIKKVEQMFKALLFFEFLIGKSHVQTQPSLIDIFEPAEFSNVNIDSSNINLSIQGIFDDVTKPSSIDTVKSRTDIKKLSPQRNVSMKNLKLNKMSQNVTPQKSPTRVQQIQTPAKIPILSFSHRRIVSYLQPQDQANRSSKQFFAFTDSTGGDSPVNPSMQLKTLADQSDSPKSYGIRKRNRYNSQVELAKPFQAKFSQWALKTELNDQEKPEIQDTTQVSRHGHGRVSLPQLKKSKFSLYAANVEKEQQEQQVRPQLQIDRNKANPYHLDLVCTKKSFFQN